MQKIRTGIICMVLMLAVSSTVFGEPAPLSLSDLENIPRYDMPLASETHHMLHIVRGKARAVAIGRPVSVVTVNPPSALQVLIQQKTLNILTRSEDSISHITATDAKGKAVMARYVLTTDPDTRYIRTHITCAAGQTDAACGQEKMFYCPDECFQMSVDLSE